VIITTTKTHVTVQTERLHDKHDNMHTALSQMQKHQALSRRLVSLPTVLLTGCTNLMFVGTPP